MKIIDKVNGNTMFYYGKMSRQATNYLKQKAVSLCPELKFSYRLTALTLFNLDSIGLVLNFKSG